MQINHPLPATTNLTLSTGFSARHPAASHCRFSSTLNAVQMSSSSSTERTKTHLSHLDKLLQKQSPAATSDQYPPSVTTASNRASIRGARILQGLSLSGILPTACNPSSAADDIMSPRHLNRLLSLPQECSPRDHLGSRWREYHGSNDWAGLLDPLDSNLRRELIRYGEFVQAAYQAFHSSPASDQALSPGDVPLRDRSYKVTKSLFATSSIGLPRWVDEVAPDIGWMTQRSSWIGYVAVCDDEREIARMGRRDIVIALRGTSTCLEWAENLRDVLVPMHDHRDQAKVECGFSSLFTTPGKHVPSLAESVVQEVRRLMGLYEGETLSISVTGHSLGAALAVLVADELSALTADTSGRGPDNDGGPRVAVFSFGGPRVGNRAFANRITANNVKVLRIVNAQDVITRVPGMFVSEELDEKLRRGSEVAGPVLDMIDSSMPWAYAHVGTELKVDTKMSPYLKPNADVACCHDLEAYLHLVDGFMASNSPFRANAKRSLMKLLSEQGGNVKKLYMSSSAAKSSPSSTSTKACLND